MTMDQQAPIASGDEQGVRGFVELDRDECLRLLATLPVGRLAVGLPGEAPEVVPVNYRLVGEDIVFRTVRGTKLDHLTTEPVSFEVDFVDSFHRCGWSVLVRGLAYQASDWEMEVEDVTVDPYLADRYQWVRIKPRSITGRRIVLPIAQPMDPRGYL